MALDIEFDGNDMWTLIMKITIMVGDDHDQFNSIDGNDDNGDHDGNNDD